MGKSKRVVIVVEDGMVESVYSDDKLVDVEIIDKDSDDGDRRGWIDEAVKELHEDVASGKLVSVYLSEGDPKATTPAARSIHSSIRR